MEAKVFRRRAQFGTIPKKLLHDPEAPDRAVRLYAILDELADDAGGSFPGLAWMGRMMNCSEDSVGRAKKFLIDRGWLIQKRRGQGKSNFYWVNDRPDPAWTPVLEPAPERYLEPAPERRIPIPNDLDPVRENARAPFEQEFEALWERYPRKLAKKAAKKAFTARRASGEPHAALEAALEGYVAEVTFYGTEAKYIMYGGTFFGPNERWRDYVGWEPPKGVELAKQSGSRAEQRFQQNLAAIEASR